jgi:hypothetical protein
MEIEFNKITLDEFFDELYKFVNDNLEDERQKHQTCTDDKCKCKYIYDDPFKKETWKGNSKPESDFDADLKRKIDACEWEISRLQKEIESKDKVISMLKNAVPNNTNNESIIEDKITADGYKIVNDIKVWVEFARKCGKNNNSCFLDMLDRISKIISCVK